MFREDRCTVCGDCLTSCSYIEIGEDEAKVEFKKLIDGEPSRIVSECISCMGCDEICPEKANPFSLIIRRQEESGEVNRFEQARKNMEGAYGVPSEVKKGEQGGHVKNEDLIPLLTQLDISLTLKEGG